MPDLMTSLELCSLCPKLCSHVCPVYRASGKETWSPQNKMASLLGLETKAEHATEAEAMPLYACTACGACSEACLHKVEPAFHLLRGRAAAEKHDLGHQKLSGLPERAFEAAEKMIGALRKEMDVAARIARPGQVGILPTCQFFSCDGQSDDGNSGEAVVASARRVLGVADSLRHRRVDVPECGVLAVGSAGYPLYAAGHHESFRLHAEKLAAELSGYSMVVADCSLCTYVLRVVYPMYGVPLKPPVLHVSEWILPYASALPVKRPFKKVWYHAPCHLERRLNIDAPRRLLARLADEVADFGPRNVNWSPEGPGGGDGHTGETPCCGAAGLLPVTNPLLASGMAAEAWAEADVDDDSPTVSGCPTCAAHLCKSGHPTHDLLWALSLAF